VVVSIVVLLVGGVLSAHAVGTYQRNQVWATEETLWEDVVQKSPRNARALMNYGLSQMSKGRYQKAKNLFDRGKVIWPNYSHLETNLGIVTDRLGDPEAAERHFKRAIQLRWNFPGGHYFYARWLVEQGRAEEALGRLKDALGISPNYSAARTMLMNLYAAKGTEAELAPLVQETLALFPQNPLSMSYAKGEFPTTAYPQKLQTVLALRQTLKKEPESEIAQKNLAQALAQLGLEEGQTQSVMSQAKVTLGVKPEESPVKEFPVTSTPLERPQGGQLFAQAISAQQTGNRQAAIARYEELLKLDPQHREGALNLAELLLQGKTKGEWVRSVLLYQKVLKIIDPNNVEALHHLASAYRKLGYQEQAGKYDREYQERKAHSEEQGSSEPRMAKIGQ